MQQYFGSLFQFGAVPVLEQSMAFNETRHRLVLSNIANANTPGYRRQDLDAKRFSSLLGGAIRDREGSGNPANFAMREDLRVRRGRDGGFEASRWLSDHSNQGALRHDENNVSMEREMALLARNAGAYSTYANLLRKSYGQLRAAIAERPTNS